MIRRTRALDRFELAELRRIPADHLRGLRLVEAMLVEARQLGVWPPRDPLEGIEHDVALAKAIHALRATGEDRR